MTAPEETLSEVRRVRERARTVAHGGAWFPVGILALLMLLSIGLYDSPFRSPDTLVISWPYLAGLPYQQHSPVVSHLFWFFGTPAAFVLIGWWYRWRARRVGMSVRWRWFIGVGLGALAALAILLVLPAGPAVYRGVGFLLLTDDPLWLPGLLSPLLVIAVAVAALGVVERSRALVVAGAWVGLTTAWECVVVMGRGTFRPLGAELVVLNLPGPTLLLMALPLVVFAAVRVWRTR